MTLKSLLWSVLLSIVVVVSAHDQPIQYDYMKREHSLTKPYGAGMNVPYWDYMGHTMVTNNYVRLTPDAQSMSGSLWNQVPCMTENWEMQVSFKVHGRGKDLFGDGMAIWYTKDRMEGGPVFGSKDYFSGLVIILDTYSNHNGPHNHQHPFLSAMVNNGTLHYDHDRDGTHTQLAGCEAKFRNVEYETILTIRYENEVLSVLTDFENKGEWKECFSAKGILLPTGYYFGVSATTGDLSDNHDIISLHFYGLDIVADPQKSLERLKIVPQALTFEPPRERSEDKKPSGMSNVKIFFLILFGMIVAVAVAIGGIMYYQKHKENSKKRFY